MINSIGYLKALALLQRASTPAGFTASIEEHDNNMRIWTRYGVINGLAALVSGEQTLIKTFRNTIQTIFNHQHLAGFIPSNVSIDGGVSYGNTVGRVDNTSWAVVGLCQYVLITRDTNLADQYNTHVNKCLALLEAWEFNGKHLVYVPQSGDWADEYIQHGYILFDQLLRVWALRLAAQVYKRKDWQGHAKSITDVIQNNFWNHQSGANLYAPILKHQLGNAPKEFWLMGFNPSEVYHQFDLQANSLALLLDIGSSVQNTYVITYIEQLAERCQNLLPSFYPSIEEGDKEMPLLKNNYALLFRNHPNEFHNGGLWPVWNGIAVTALKKQNQSALAETLTRYIHQANTKSDWQFNECLHGKTHKPIGMSQCTWSASGAILAEKALKGSTLHF